MERLKKLFANKKFVNGLNKTIFTISLIGIVILLNIILYRYSFKKDFSESKIYELSDQTKTVLSTLSKTDKTINAYFFTSTQNDYLEAKVRNRIEGLLNQYSRTSRNINFKVINIEANPALVQQYFGTTYDVVFDMNNRVKKVSLIDMYDGMNFNGEQAFTSSIMYLTNQNPTVVYYLQGHKEAVLGDISALKKSIEQEGYEIKALNILQNGRIPDDAKIIIDIGAQTEFDIKEIAYLKTYLETGGKALFLMSSLYENGKINNLNSMFSNYGITVNNDIVEDTDQSTGSSSIVIPSFGDNEIVNKLKQYNMLMLTPQTRSISISPNTKGAIVTQLLTSSSKSWGETSVNDDKNKKAVQNRNEKKGPLTIAAFATKKVDENSNMGLIIVGNDILATDNFLSQKGTWTEVDFVLNCLGSLSEKKDSITIRSKPIDVKQFTLPYNKQIILFLGLVIALPLAIFIAGIAVWVRRRYL